SVPYLSFRSAQVNNPYYSNIRFHPQDSILYLSSKLGSFKHSHSKIMTEPKLYFFTLKYSLIVLVI
ncbi:MAG: hypothetical protein ACHQXG_09870, partial [Nitrososphaerales archaeon]